MPNLSQIIQVQISRATKGVSQVGFGTPLILGTSSNLAGPVVRTYTELAGVAADFASTAPEYQAAAAIFSQQISPAQIKIAYRATGQNAPAMADALAAICQKDNDWYCLVLTSRVAADILAAAAFIETQEKIFIACSDDAHLFTTDGDDIASELKAAGYARTALIASGAQASYPDAAWAGLCLPLDPGSETWKFKTLQGVAADALTATQSQNVKGKSANTYESYAGVSITGEGTMADGEFIDVIRFTDWLKSRIQERIFSKLVNAKKIPYSDAGAAVIEAEIRAQLLAGVAVGGLIDGSLAVSVPKIADQNPNDRAHRFMPGFQFSANLAGAIHKVSIQGTVSV